MSEKFKNSLNKHRNEYLAGTQESSDKARILYSPEPLPNEVKKVRSIRNIFIVVFVLSLLYSASVGEVTSFSALAFLAFAVTATVDEFKVKIKAKTLRSMKFVGSKQMDNNNLFAALQPSLMKFNATMGRADNGCPSIEFKGFKYDIILNDDGTFCLWWRTKSVVSGKGLLGYYSLYKIHIVSMGILAYEIQSIYGINRQQNQGVFLNQQ